MKRYFAHLRLKVVGRNGSRTSREAVTPASETEDVTVDNLLEDDRVDLESCPYLHGHPSAPLKYSIVVFVHKVTPGCVLVGYEGIDLVGYEPGTVLRRRRRQAA